MAKTYVGLAMSSTMFTGDMTITRRMLSADDAKSIISGEIVSCFNPSHIGTIEALRTRFGIEVEIPETAPKVTLEMGDTLLVLSARFKRRLNEGEVHSLEEINSASFEFVEYTILNTITCRGCGKQMINRRNCKHNSGFWIKCEWCNFDSYI